MSKAIENFRQISKIPRPSKKEEKIREFLVDWAIIKNMDYVIDQAWNLVIYVSWTPDKKDNAPVILQAHMDMVCVKTAESTHDFEKDPIEIIEENWIMRALDTSLWADNGVWVAIAMSMVDSESHPPLELVFTVDEEQWMSWVLNLDFNLLSAKTVINIDNENENEVCISSAGWARLEINKKLDFKNPTFKQYSLVLSWMKWWHSWVEIDKNQGNAIIVLFNFLSQYQGRFEIVSINSGVAINVIPSTISIVIWIEDIEDFNGELTLYLKDVMKIHDCPSLKTEIAESGSNLEVIDDTLELVEVFLNIKSGVYSMSSKIPSLVQTSMNLWILKTDEGALYAAYLPRSSVNLELWELIDSTISHFTDAGYDIIKDEWYPGWQDDPDCELVNIAVSEISKQTLKTPNIIAIHAWLECGALVAWLWDWAHAIAIWPNMHDVHSTREWVEVASVEKIEKAVLWMLSKL
jgi:dipeptidase D